MKANATSKKPLVIAIHCLIGNNTNINYRFKNAQLFCLFLIGNFSKKISANFIL